MARLQNHILPSEDIAAIYRFALLLAGTPAAAQSTMLETFADAGEKLHHFRSGKSCTAWLVAKVRNRFLNRSLPTAQERVAEATVAADEPGLVASPEVLDLADRFSKLPEPGRSGLALLYLDQFSVQEIAQILQINVEELADAVGVARDRLRAAGTEAAA